MSIDASRALAAGSPEPAAVYRAEARALHWLTAILVLAMLAAGQAIVTEDLSRRLCQRNLA